MTLLAALDHKELHQQTYRDWTIILKEATEERGGTAPTKALNYSSVPVEMHTIIGFLVVWIWSLSHGEDPANL